jgi:hypothetical protein
MQRLSPHYDLWPRVSVGREGAEWFEEQDNKNCKIISTIVTLNDFRTILLVTYRIGIEEAIKTDRMRFFLLGKWWLSIGHEFWGFVGIRIPRQFVIFLMNLSSGSFMGSIEFRAESCEWRATFWIALVYCFGGWHEHVTIYPKTHGHCIFYTGNSC